MKSLTKADLPDLKDEINDLHRKGIEAAKWTLKYFADCGHRLAAVREILPRGEFTPWLLENFDGGRSTAYRYMKLAANVSHVKQTGSMREAFRLLGEYDQTPQEKAESTPERPPDETRTESRREASGGSPPFDYYCELCEGEYMASTPWCPYCGDKSAQHQVNISQAPPVPLSKQDEVSDETKELSSPQTTAPDSSTPPPDASAWGAARLGSTRGERTGTQTFGTSPADQNQKVQRSEQPEVGGQAKRRSDVRPDDAIKVEDDPTGTPRRSAFDIELAFVNRTISFLEVLYTTTKDNTIKEYIVGLRRAVDTLRRYSPTQVDVPLPDWIDCDLWDKWMILRGKKGKAITATGALLVIDKLAKYRADGQDVDEIIRQSLREGWQGFFPVKDEKAAPAGGAFKSFKEQQQERERESDFLTSTQEYITEEEYLARFNGQAP